MLFLSIARLFPRGHQEDFDDGSEGAGLALASLAGLLSVLLVSAVAGLSAGLSAWVDSCRLRFLSLLKSVSYQPLPLRRNAAAEIKRLV